MRVIHRIWRQKILSRPSLLLSYHLNVWNSNSVRYFSWNYRGDCFRMLTFNYILGKFELPIYKERWNFTTLYFSLPGMPARKWNTLICNWNKWQCFNWSKPKVMKMSSKAARSASYGRRMSNGDRYTAAVWKLITVYVSDRTYEENWTLGCEQVE